MPSKPNTSSRPGGTRPAGGPARPGQPHRPGGFRPGGSRPGGNRPGGGRRGPMEAPRRPIVSVDESDPEGAVEVEGMIIQVLAGTMFKVELTNKHVVLAHISGKMRKRFIKLVIGDRVKMEMSPYDTTKGRITFRL